MIIGGMLGSFIFRFFFFFFKIISSCLFVMMLQARIGGNSVEYWIEQSLQTSYFGQKLKQKVVLGQKIVYQKFKILKNSRTKNLSSQFAHQPEEFFTTSPESDYRRKPSAVTEEHETSKEE